MVEEQEWAAQAEGFKAEGNKLLADKQFVDAVEMYTRAIELDPDNAVYLQRGCRSLSSEEDG
ncbi:hypothetical protein DVH05_012867 [Phytophthora capsici]|nr:hypothetical protein DVH05_012867 [Phytophthora capsici]